MVATGRFIQNGKNVLSRTNRNFILILFVLILRVYCKYHYLEGHEFDTPESELLHFLNRTYDRNFKWRQQYEPSIKNGSEPEDFEKSIIISIHKTS